MDTRGNDRLREMLAAEYALGTLRGGARRRFERLARDDDGLRLLALQWGDRLAPLIDGLPSRVPPRRVWDGIAARLPGGTVRHAGGVASVVPWWERLAFWRGLALATTFAALVAIGVDLVPRPEPAPRLVRVETMPSAIATLVEPKTGKPVAVVFTAASGDAMTVRVAADVDVPAGHVLQLWMAPRDAEGLLSMGVLPGDARQVAAHMAGLDAATLKRAKAFGLSLEPIGGSPQPTKVLGLGALVGIAS